MRKIASNIFVALFILYFVSQESDALAREGCMTFDLLCHVSGKGAKDTIDPDKNVEGSKKDLDKKLSEARLLLIKSIQIILRNGLNILGISHPEKM